MRSTRAARRDRHRGVPLRDGNRCTPPHDTRSTTRRTSASSSNDWSSSVTSTADASSPWSFTFGGYIPEQDRLREAQLHRRQRVPRHPGLRAGGRRRHVHYPGTYSAGSYNRLTDEVSVVRIENESLVNLPNWLSLEIPDRRGDWSTSTPPTCCPTAEHGPAPGRAVPGFPVPRPRRAHLQGVQRRIAAMHLRTRLRPWRHRLAKTGRAQSNSCPRSTATCATRGWIATANLSDDHLVGHHHP